MAAEAVKDCVLLTSVDGRNLMDLESSLEISWLESGRFGNACQHNGTYFFVVMKSK